MVYNECHLADLMPANVVLGRYKLHEGHFKTIEEAQEEAMRSIS